MSKVVNQCFKNYLFDWEHRFQLIVGGYGSSKSYHTALKLVLKAAQENDRKILVCRQVYRTLKESCYDLLKEIIYDLNLDSHCTFKGSPLGIEFNNGSRFLFVGLDDPAKLKSVHGVSIVWMEEASESSYASFKELNGRLRTLDKSMHIVMSTNPISKNNWIYKHFFTDKGLNDELLYKEKEIKLKDTYYHHSTVDDNKFVPASYKEQLEKMQIHDPDLYRVARLGRFGTLGEKVFHNVFPAEHEEVMKAVADIPRNLKFEGLDFGFKVSYNAFIRCALDLDNRYLYIYDEFYCKDLINSEVAERLQFLKDAQYSTIIADSSRPELIEEIRRSGIKIKASKKGRGSELEGVQKIKSFYKIIISDKCRHAYRDIAELTYKKDKNDEIIEDEFSFDPHALDALRYALENVNRQAKAIKNPLSL